MLNQFTKIIFCYYMIINIISFLLYREDKNRAKKQLWRIPEKVLFLTAFAGGASGSLLGMQICHHKTQKKYFWILNLLALAIHIVLSYFLLTV